MDSSVTDTPARKRPGCLAALGLTMIAAVIIAGIVGWKFLDASSGVAKRGLSFLEDLPEKFLRNLIAILRQRALHRSIFQGVPNVLPCSMKREP